MHFSPNFATDEAVLGKLDVVAGIIPNFLGGAPRLDSRALAAVHGGAKTAVLDVKAKVAGAFLGV